MQLPLPLRRSLPWLIAALIAVSFAYMTVKPIYLTASDMGRHLTNGRLFLDDGMIATTNLYSYTHPDFPFWNHHWGSGVLFELARRAGGFTAVSLLGAFIIVASAFLYAFIATERGKIWLTVAAAVIVAPVFSGRAEIRPELWSYVLSGIFLLVLLRVRDGRWPTWTLFLLPLLTLLWVNLHIYFFLGFGWIGAFFVDALVRAGVEREQRATHLQQATYLGGILAACAVAAIGNPNGWQGAVYPLLIFQNYAYEVAENQTILRMMQEGTYPPALYGLIAVIVVVLSWVLRLWRDWVRRTLPDIAILILSVFAAFIAWKAILNFSIFSYVQLVALSYIWSDLAWPEVVAKWRQTLQAAVIGVLALGLYLVWPSYWPIVMNTSSLGTFRGIERSLEFFKENDLQGPIFNNYDIGSYLTYGLYPTERVFVDNRPEAYPGEFFTETLLPMQDDDAVWQRMDRVYGFNVIYFYRHDATDWGQAFLIRRVQDAAWAPIFVDDSVLMFVKRTPENAAVIAEHELPKSMFQIRKQ